MPWGTAPADEVPSQQSVENVAEERIRQIVRDELAKLAAKGLTDAS